MQSFVKADTTLRSLNALLRLVLSTKSAYRIAFIWFTENTFSCVRVDGYSSVTLPSADAGHSNDTLTYSAPRLCIFSQVVSRSDLKGDSKYAWRSACPSTSSMIAATRRRKGLSRLGATWHSVMPSDLPLSRSSIASPPCTSVFIVPISCSCQFLLTRSTPSVAA